MTTGSVDLERRTVRFSEVKTQKTDSRSRRKRRLNRCRETGIQRLSFNDNEKQRKARREETEKNFNLLKTMYYILKTKCRENRAPH